MILFKNYKAILIIFINTFVVFLIINLIFVFFSPYFMNQVSSNFAKNISSCYRSYYHFDLNNFSNKNLEVIFGDSYSEGSGDEFLNGKKNYGLYKKNPLKTTFKEIWPRFFYKPI